MLNETHGYIPPITYHHYLMASTPLYCFETEIQYKVKQVCLDAVVGLHWDAEKKSKNQRIVGHCNCQYDYQELRWFGDAERKDDAHWVKLSVIIEVDGTKTFTDLEGWHEDSKDNMKSLRRSQEDAQFRNKHYHFQHLFHRFIFRRWLQVQTTTNYSPWAVVCWCPDSTLAAGGLFPAAFCFRMVQSNT